MTWKWPTNNLVSFFFLKKSLCRLFPAWRKTTWLAGKDSKQPLNLIQSLCITISSRALSGGKKVNSLCLYVTVGLDPSCYCLWFHVHLCEVYSGDRKIIYFSYLLHVLSYIVQSLSQPHVSCKILVLVILDYILVDILHCLYHTRSTLQGVKQRMVGCLSCE